MKFFFRIKGVVVELARHNVSRKAPRKRDLGFATTSFATTIFLRDLALELVPNEKASHPELRRYAY